MDVALTTNGVLINNIIEHQPNKYNKSIKHRFSDK